MGKGYNIRKFCAKHGNISINIISTTLETNLVLWQCKLTIVVHSSFQGTKREFIYGYDLILGVNLKSHEDLQDMQAKSKRPGKY